jgi:hypothetical protein
MRLSLVFGSTGLLASLSLSFAAQAAAQERSIFVEYVAPAECASTDAFQSQVESEVARSPNPHRTWQWSVHIVSRDGTQGGYVATVTNAGGARTMRAPRCDDLTAAVAALIAEEGADAPATAPAVPPPPPPKPPAPPSPVAPVAPVESPHDALRDRRSAAPEWRLGARSTLSNHGVGGAALTGLFGVVSFEVPWGPRKALFELGGGVMSSQAGGGGAPLDYVVLDAQACPFDAALGDTGLSALGCLRLAGASFKTTSYAYDDVAYSQSGGALWAGAGARLRWQSHASVFLEGSLDAVYGTVSEGESTSPGWVDVALSAGFRL